LDVMLVQRRLGSALASRRARAGAARARVGAHAKKFLATVARTMQENGHAASSSSASSGKGAADAAKEVAKEAATNGAKNGAKGAAKKGGSSLMSWWKGFEKGAKDMGNRVAVGVATEAKKLKGPAMEMKVNVDVLKPTIDGFKHSLGEFWVQVPPPVRKASPYVGVACLTALVIHSVESRLRHASEKKLALKMALMEEEKIALADRLKELESNRYLRGDSTVDLSRAVAESTAAAAQAASAAAEAARYCIARPL